MTATSIAAGVVSVTVTVTVKDAVFFTVSPLTVAVAVTFTVSVFCVGCTAV